VATTAGIVLSDALSRTPALAQHTEDGAPVPCELYTPHRARVQRDIICMCGTCGRKNLAECTCARPPKCARSSPGSSGREDAEEIIQYYVAKYGSQEPLSSPIDKGFNRLAWFFPYAVGGFAAVGGRVRRPQVVAALARRRGGSAVKTRAVSRRRRSCRRASIASSKILD
jgi:hypothetical protein